MTRRSPDQAKVQPVKPATDSSSALDASSPRRDVEKLYQLVLAEEKRLRLWLSHMAQDFPDNPLATVAIRALAGDAAPSHCAPKEK